MLQRARYVSEIPEKAVVVHKKSRGESWLGLSSVDGITCGKQKDAQTGPKERHHAS
jgi:hypothetical protein